MILNYTYARYLYAFLLVLCCSNVSATVKNDTFANLQIDIEIRLIIENLGANYAPSSATPYRQNKDTLTQVYEQRRFKPLWIQETASGSFILGRTAGELIETITDIGNQGLIPDDYHLTTIQNFGTMPISASFDVLLTDIFLTLSQHLLAGKVNPETLTPEWKSYAEKIEPLHLVSKLEQQSLTSIFDDLKPRQDGYNKLIAALAYFNTLAGEQWQPLQLGKAIKVGNADPRLTEIATRLRFLGDLNQDLIELSSYDETLAQAVIHFQLRHGLEGDGIIGNDTLAMLNMTPTQRANKIKVNLERFRWLDRHMGNTYVVVNIANFDLKVVKNSKVLMEMPVIVGRDYRKTPVFSDNISYLVANPTWTVPRTIAVKDKLDEIKKDSTYLSRMGFTLYDPQTGNVVAPSSINWNNYSKSFPFRMVQKPGELNALGRVKFMFPNQYDVYLHDTPARDLFSKHQRAFSSGCIRVSQPLALAKLLLSEQNTTEQDFDKIMNSNETKTVYLKQPIPIHIEYWTTWVDEQGTLQQRADIYQRDDNVLAALQKPL